MCGRVLCYHDKNETPDRNALKLGTVIVLDNMSKPIHFGLKRSWVMGTRSSFRTSGTSYH